MIGQTSVALGGALNQGSQGVDTGQVSDAGREITSLMPMMTLDYVRRALGDDGVEAVFARAGVDPSDPALSTEQEWVSLATAAAIADAAGDLCCEAEIGQRIADQYFLHHRDNGVRNFLLAEGSPQAAIELAVQFASRMSEARQFDVREVTETSVVVEGRRGATPGPSRFFCEMASTYMGKIPALFDADGSSVHRRCIDRGDDRCEFVITWDRPVALVAEDAERNRGVADQAIARFEDFQAMSAALTEADELGDVLELVVHYVSLAVMAPKFLITVQPREGDSVQAASIGFAASDIDRTSAALWSGDVSHHNGLVLRAPIASPHHSYGYLAAYLPEDAVQLDIDERLLHAYAHHATSAIERAVSIEDARRSHQTATALLQLAGRLAAAPTIQDVCREVATAVPDVVGCEIGGVWLWDDAAAVLHLQGWTEGWDAPLTTEVRAEQLITLGDVASDPQPLFFNHRDADPVIRSLLDDRGAKEAYAAPIVLRGRFLGFVTALARQVAPSVTARELMMERLVALADHAMTALDSSMLLEQVRHQAMHDALTGLPNRALAEARSREVLAAAARSGEDVALMFADLDRFKNVNDTLGHSAGDELIRQVAARMTSVVGGRGVVARLGGDEFFVLLPGPHAAESAVGVADAIIEAVRQPFEIRGRSLYISASVGIACYPDHSDDYATLMSHADAAMYQAKAYGRSRYAVHAEELSTEREQKLRLESELHLALERGELVVHYQPQVDLLSHRIVGVEALVRWNHPTRGLIGPDTFLSIAEESGVIVEIDAFVRRSATERARSWADAGLDLRMALNLSTRDLRNPDIVDELRGVIEAAGIRPGLLELEITDRVVMSNDHLPAVMEGLRTLGTRIAIDDFGTGSSVLSRLQHCPVDVLKIDRSFISELTGDNGDARLVNALISMAHALELSVVAEGVETEEQASILLRYGCDIGQGFLFSPAVPGEEIALLVAQSAALSSAT